MGRHRKKGSVPVRTGLLGASAAVAAGVVALATGVLPADSLHLTSDGGHETVGADRSPSGLRTQTGAELPPWARAGTGSASPSDTPAKGSGKPEPRPERSGHESAEPKKSPRPERTATPEKSTAPSRTAAPRKTTAPERTTAAPRPTRTSEPPASPSPGGDPETQVLNLVNEERAAAGCSPVKPDAELAALAENFSKDMDARDFFDHTDPDGDTPWDRAEQAGISGLGGENIARGQADAEAVMDSWMNSEGHRANILNCEFTRLGVGAHFGDGGPWWTQDFGY